MAADLGEIRKVQIRHHWVHEEHEFTPWLAQEENIARLANAIGLELQVEGIEVPVGPFTADVLAKDASENYVLIENQFGRTDHGHLGKMLTYAATLDATAIVWIAEKFTEEHRKAIEWLNESVSDDLRLYAVEMELWQIDQSRPALRFNVLSEPTVISKQANAVKAAGEMTAARKLQYDFWTAVRDELLERKILTSAHTPRPQYWYNVALGRSNIHLSNIANTAEGKIGVRVYISNRVANAALPQFEAQRSEIESEIGRKLEWDPNPDAGDKVIRLQRDADLADRDRWPEYISWLVEMIDKFKKTFGPRVKRLSLDDTAA
ncbi:DUF4268 domain-containing protein [Methyloceanibacter sp.]|uniref:DUF4268 domain-containing protein n=1 Tax=Methyloceanibacter sp. TaxID=1965321 RepID=UPI002C2FDBB0|nr:DUF4268 domain-containing protein [Methyloceanibacter sp.]HML91091.1 DUF4268 domain-containing protein [Methyloceanibacter sp.]